MEAQVVNNWASTSVDTEVMQLYRSGNLTGLTCPTASLNDGGCLLWCQKLPKARPYGLGTTEHARGCRQRIAQLHQTERGQGDGGGACYTYSMVTYCARCDRGRNEDGGARHRNGDSPGVCGEQTEAPLSALDWGQRTLSTLNSQGGRPEGNQLIETFNRVDQFLSGVGFGRSQLFARTKAGQPAGTHDCGCHSRNAHRNDACEYHAHRRKHETCPDRDPDVNDNGRYHAQERGFDDFGVAGNGVQQRAGPVIARIIAGLPGHCLGKDLLLQSRVESEGGGMVYQSIQLTEGGSTKRESLNTRTRIEEGEARRETGARNGRHGDEPPRKGE